MSTECSKSERKCYFCNREGHMKRDCRQYIKWKSKQKSEQDRENAIQGHNDKTNEKVVQKMTLSLKEIMSKCDQAGIFVEADIGGEYAKLLLDTGATVSLIAPHIVQRLTGNNAESQLEQIDAKIFIADGSPLNISGITPVAFKIADMGFTHKMIVANISIDGILGFDFMRQHSCTLDIANEMLTVKNEKVLIETEGQIGCYEACLNEPICIYPRRESVSTCTL